MPKVQTSLRLEEATFQEAKGILNSLGMNFTEAVNIFTAMVVQKGGLPFEVQISNYPAISHKQAQKKVRKSLDNITDRSGIDSDVFFDRLLES